MEFKGTNLTWVINSYSEGDDIPIGGLDKDGLHEADIAIIEDFGKEFREEKLANAQLIASAPELLEALQELYRITKDYHVGNDALENQPTLYKWENKVFIKAENAINKALGNESK